MATAKKKKKPTPKAPPKLSDQKPLLTEETTGRAFYRVDQVGGPHDWALIEMVDGKETILAKDAKQIIHGYFIGLLKNNFDKSRFARLRQVK